MDFIVVDAQVGIGIVLFKKLTIMAVLVDYFDETAATLFCPRPVCHSVFFPGMNDAIRTFQVQEVMRQHAIRVVAVLPIGISGETIITFCWYLKVGGFYSIIALGLRFRQTCQSEKAGYNSVWYKMHERS